MLLLVRLRGKVVLQLSSGASVNASCTAGVAVLSKAVLPRGVCVLQLGSAPVVMGMSKACMTTHVDSCELAARDEASSVLFVVLVLLYVLMYYMYMYRAFR